MRQWPAAGKRFAGLGLLALLLILGPGGYGCGYHLRPTGENIGKDIKKIFVASFANNTPEANIETSFRNAFIDQFIKGRRFQIVNAEGLADAVLKGEIRNLVVAPLAYRGDSNLAVEKRITVTLSLTLEAKGTPAALWHEESFAQWGDYALDSNNLSAAAVQASQKNALSKLADDVAERAYRIMITDF